MLAVSVFVIAEVGDHEIAVAPVFLDAYPGLQKDLRAHEALAVLAIFGSPAPSEESLFHPLKIDTPYPPDTA